VFAVVGAASVFWKTRVMGKKVVIANEGAAFLSSLMLLSYILYIYIVRTTLDVFNCVPTSESGVGRGCQVTGAMTTVALQCSAPCCFVA
jgi:hypothetical protein